MNIYCVNETSSNNGLTDVLTHTLSHTHLSVYLWKYTHKKKNKKQDLQSVILFRAWIICQRQTSYIYIYICYPQTDCFSKSQIFRVVRHARCFKLGSKPGRYHVGCLTPEPSSFSALVKEIFINILFTYTLLVPGSAQFMRRDIAFQLMW